MDYQGKHIKKYDDPDKTSQASLRQGSITSDLDDLTVIAEFASSDDEELATIYKISNPYEVVGCSIKSNATFTNDLNSNWLSSESGDDLDVLVENNTSTGNSKKKLHGREKRTRLKSAGSQTATAKNSRATSPVDDFLTNEKENMTGKVNPFLNKTDTKNVGTMTVGRDDRSNRKIPLVHTFVNTDSLQLKNASTCTERDESQLEIIKQLKETLSGERGNLKNKTEQYESLLDEYDMMREEDQGCQASVAQQSKSTQDDLTMEAELKDKLSTTDNEIASIRNELDAKSESIDILLEDLEIKEKEIEELKNQTNSLKSDLERFKNENDELKHLSGLQIKKNETESSVLKKNERLQNELNKVSSDLLQIQQNLGRANKVVEEKSFEIEKLKNELEEFRRKEIDLDRIIESLKNQLHMLNDKISQRVYEDMQQNNKTATEKEHEENLLKEITRLMQLNSDLHRIISTSNIHNEDYQELSRKYNELRNISSRLQTAIAPLKAKLSLANKKCRAKNNFLEEILKSDHGNKIPTEFRQQIENSLKDDEHYRALSPLTIDRIERLEHNLINHLHDRLPYHDSARVQSFSNLLGETTTYNPFKPSTSKSMTDLHLISLLDNNSKLPNSSQYDRHTASNGDHVYRNDLLYKRTPTLIDTPSKTKLENVVGDDSYFFSKDFKNKHESTSLSNMSARPTSFLNNISKENRPKKTDVFDTLAGQPRNFQIEKVANQNRKFYFCWEPPVNDIKDYPVIGYEFYVNGIKKDYIPGRRTTNYAIDYVSSKSLPIIFALRSITLDGVRSRSSEIILHGLQHIRNDDSLEKITTGKHQLEKSTLDLTQLKKQTFIAFYDFNATDNNVIRNGISYSEISFETGDMLETFGEVLPNGYIFGRVKGTDNVGLIPANFLEKTF
ncbi:hypothetical protein HELRODRAFT_171677 [Helobdella robusta]|uniref:SH3 domain-containing protein n=1 Tax=Helobdella robusta TaxID=6412 RepID=T1F4J4_HELRO|nr:hypothetical protein HELRODRAFT_171677 [Helobdella robusta]ESO05309.1 hypothetical protein HELRODRAFT_171677 [Helobdella robusta]